MRMFSRLTEESRAPRQQAHRVHAAGDAPGGAAGDRAHRPGAEFVAGRFSPRRACQPSRTKTDRMDHARHGRAPRQATTTRRGPPPAEVPLERRCPWRHRVHIQAAAAATAAATRARATRASSSAPGSRASGRRRSRVAAARRPPSGSGAGERGGPGRIRPRPGAHPEDRGLAGRRRQRRQALVDTVKTRTWFLAEHTSDAKTQSVTNTEEQTSHNRSESRSRTSDGASVGDEITFELVYDHRSSRRRSMALPEDRWLAPHVVAGAAATAESRMVALVIDPWSSAPTRSPRRSLRTRSRPTNPPPRGSPPTSPTTSASPAPPSARPTRPARGSAGPPSGVQPVVPPRHQEEQHPDGTGDEYLRGRAGRR